MIMIIHNVHDAASRAFVEANGADYQVIDWYGSDEVQKLALQLLNVAAMSSFPAVVNTETRQIVSQPATMDAALKVFQGLDQDHILATRIAQVDVKTTELIAHGFSFTAGGKTLRFTLDSIDQQNISRLDAKKSSITSWPFQVKGFNAQGFEEYMYLANLTEVTEFIAGMDDCIATRRAEAWAVKIPLQQKTYAQLLAFTDTRS